MAQIDFTPMAESADAGKTLVLEEFTPPFIRGFSPRNGCGSLYFRLGGKPFR